MTINRTFALTVVGLVLIGGLFVAALSQGWLTNDQLVRNRKKSTNNESESASEAGSKPPAPARKLSESLGVSESEISEIGGIARPSRDANFKPSISTLKQPPKNPLPPTGRLPALKGDENSQVAGLFAELSGPKPPKEAISATFLPQEFDRERYFENPEEYLTRIRPGRVFRPAQPSDDVKPIAAASPRHTTLIQGEKSVLRVRADPQYPVTFYTPDGGEFSNRLKTISVAANENGIAEAVYTAVPGTNGIMDVISASPLHSGQVKFAIKVVIPDGS